MQKVYYARPEVLQEKVPRTFKFFPVADHWYLKMGAHTEFCPESGHEPNGIRFRMGWQFVPVCHGYWWLKVPIDIKTTMPGTGHMLAHASIESMINVGWGTWILENSRRFRFVADGDIIFQALNEKIVQGDGEFYANNYVINKSIEGYETLDCCVASVLRCLTGGFNTHFRSAMATVEYVPTVPPEPATVRIYVYNRETAKAIRGSLVQLLSGSKVVAQGYTGWDGWASFENVPAGVEGVSYTLLVTAGGYEEYKDSVDVVPGENTFRVPLVAKPAPPIPWEWILIGGAVVVVGGVLLARRKPAPPVVVVRE